MRLPKADYNGTGAYFITICTKNRCCLLSGFVGPGVPDGPHVELLPYGKIAEKYIKQLNKFYNHISVESYVIMPNHIHLLLFAKASDGPSRTPVPTVQNSVVSRFVSTFKRFCNKEYGENIWQYRSYDHIIRNRQDYDEHIQYIYENPIRWYYDELYSET
ncbi:MAG: transposase [Clostridia bacterium]|nr:transposase [Clostridia bacterium]